MKITTLLIVLSALLMIWVAALQANAAMTDRRLQREANLGRKADVGAATDANSAATVVTSSTDGAADDDTNPNPGKYAPSSDTFTHRKYPDDQNPNPKN
ncbi:hypothetical protein SLEP1_g45878 [Rubroshorea leprosula]|uniref:Uncharacterized protein n=1 Tax=Rubroshorea leprosula TaxID=152421 RepID=A0AAV5LKP8_9ROSI|nr:hypothetical protein SLEP1_g45878 [Rubroshorea leprosula]